MYKGLLVLILVTSVAAGQSGQNVPILGSIDGVVKDAATNAPILRATVLVVTSAASANGEALLGADSKRISTTVDEEGRYSFAGLPLGRSLVVAHFKGLSVSKAVTLNLGQEHATADFALAVGGSISGAVLDEDENPVPGLRVYLVTKEYRSGDLRSAITDGARTDDRGEYRLEHAEPGRSYLVLARRGDPLAPVSDVPADIKSRKPVLVATYYPNSPRMEGAVAVELPRNGGNVEGVNIRMSRQPCYCIEGTVEAGGSPSALNFFIEADQLMGGTFFSLGGKAGPDGIIRICDLPPGLYRLSALRFPTEASAVQPLHGYTTVNVSSKDVHKVIVLASPGQPVSGKVVWDGTPPDKPDEGKVSIELQPIDRAMVLGEVLAAKSSIPGGFRLPSLLMGDYSIKFYVTSPSIYVKDITYAGVSILHETLRFGTTMADAEIRVVLAHDGGSVIVAVTDKDRNPIQYANVLIMPARVASQVELASGLIWGQADQRGIYTSRTLPPGDYDVVATEALVSNTYESISRLWGSRTKASRIQVGAGQNLQIAVEPITLD